MTLAIFKLSGQIYNVKERLYTMCNLLKQSWVNAICICCTRALTSTHKVLTPSNLIGGAGKVSGQGGQTFV